MDRKRLFTSSRVHPRDPLIRPKTRKILIRDSRNLRTIPIAVNFFGRTSRACLCRDGVKGREEGNDAPNKDEKWMHSSMVEQ